MEREDARGVWDKLSKVKRNKSPAVGGRKRRMGNSAVGWSDSTYGAQDVLKRNL